MKRYFRRKQTRKKYIGGIAIRKKRRKKTKKVTRKKIKKRNVSKKSNFNKDSCSPVKKKMN